MSERERIGVGLIGQGFMGRAHSRAIQTVTSMGWPPPLVPVAEVVAGRDAQRLGDFARAFGWARTTTDWRELVADPAVGLVVHGGPNALHHDVVVAAAAAGKHVLCEKPLGRDATESRALLAAAHEGGVVAMTGFNHRFVPALRVARDLVRGGELGELRQVRIRYLQDWLAVPSALGEGWRMDPAQQGGVLGDTGSHAVDLVRYVADEITGVSGGVLRAFDGRPVEDVALATLELASGATGTLEVSRVALGRRNALQLEVNGTAGSVAFDLERLNELHVYRDDGFTRVLVTEASHPDLDLWWPPGHTLGWDATFAHEMRRLLRAIAGGGELGPHGATFEDGLRASEVCDAIRASAEAGGAPVAAAR